MAGGRVRRISMPPESRLNHGPHRILLMEVHALYRNAGCPSTRRISSLVDKMDSARDVISHQAVANILNGRSFPAWPKVEVLVAALLFLVNSELAKFEMDRIRDLWLSAHYEEEGFAPSVGIFGGTSSASSPTRPVSAEEDDLLLKATSFSTSQFGGSLKEESESECAPDEGVADDTPSAEEGNDPTGEEIRVRFVSSNTPGPAMFSIDLMAGMLQVVVNNQHPLGASITRLMDRGDDEASRVVKLLLISWARMEDEIPSDRARSKVSDVRNDWGRYARLLEEPAD